MGRSVRRRLAALGAAVVLALSGCTSGPPDLSRDAAARLQAAVLEVSESAAQGRYDAAHRALEDVRAVLVRAAEEGEVSAARYAEVEAALRHVEEELAAHRSEDADGDGSPDDADDAVGTATGTDAGTDGATDEAGDANPPSGEDDDAVGTPVSHDSHDAADTDADGASDDGPSAGPGEGPGRGPGDAPGQGGPGENGGRGPGDAPGRGGPGENPGRGQGGP